MGNSAHNGQILVTRVVGAIHSKLSVQSQLEAVVTAQRLGIINACDES